MLEKFGFASKDKKDKSKNIVQNLTAIPKKDKGGNMPHTEVFEKNTTHQIDLLSLPSDAGYDKLVVVVDLASRMIGAEPIKNKSSATVLKAVQKIYANSKYLETPIFIEVDQGSEFKAEREELLQATNGYIDMFQIPKAKYQTLRVFYYNTKSISKPEPITAQESLWLSKAMMGGLIYAKEGEHKDVKTIDQNTMYGYYLQSKQFILPVKQGTFLTITDDDIKSFPSFGIYRCKITSTDQSKDKLFRFNPENYYTHYDISNAKSLGFEINMIQDGQANHLFYDGSDRILGDKVFKPTIDYLYDLKRKYPHISFIKSMISCLWGGLSEKYYQSISSNVERDLKNVKVEKIFKLKGELQIKYSEIGQPFYKTDYARVGTFITSVCRKKMSEFVQKNFDVSKVIRIHTDSVTTPEKINDKLIGKEIGMFKVEKQGNCVIKNVNNVTWT